ncbi:MAG: hypothetical protein QOD77_642 [Thermoplasmata archaeon]|jgi:hypothetical protein|nr:hypothetical protein [Thermoplasmata archaeon]
MVGVDWVAMAMEMVQATIWSMFVLLLATGILWGIDRATHQWFDLRVIGRDPQGIAILAAGVVIATVLIIGFVLVALK